MLHVEVPWKLIDDYINAYLLERGIDTKKKVVMWTKYENDRITLVYEQEENAELNTEGKMEQALIKRPSYLERYK